jgi:ferredoxin-NADP reductase
MNTIQLIVGSIKQETRDTATFYLRPANGERVTYQAGQFITLVFAHHDEEILRSYSLSSSPHEELLSITVKRISNGEISRFMLSHVKPGDMLTAIQPAGRFVLPENSSHRQLIYFAAGSGIVPVFAQLKYALARGLDLQFTLIYSSQSNTDIIFKVQLDELALAHTDHLSIKYLISDEANRLNNLMVEKLVKQLTNGHYDDTLFYICGPFAYMRMIQFALHYMGLQSGNIHKENFVLETIPVTSSIINFPPHQIRIRLKNEWYDLMVGENQSILQAALQNNIQLPYSCRSGACSACFAKCTSGKVEVTSNEVLTPEDMENGYILTCTGHPLTDDVVIEFN